MTERKDDGLRLFAVNSATVIQPEDLVFQQVDDIRPAADFVWQVNLLTTQRAFAKAFSGLARDRSQAGETAPVGVYVKGREVYITSNTSQTYEIGDLLAVARDGVATAILSDTVTPTVDVASAILKVSRREATATTRVWAEELDGAQTGNAPAANVSYTGIKGCFSSVSSGQSDYLMFQFLNNTPATFDVASVQAWARTAVATSHVDVRVGPLGSALDPTVLSAQIQPVAVTVVAGAIVAGADVEPGEYVTMVVYTSASGLATELQVTVLLTPQ